jgi:hypothetical protein
MGKMDGYRSYRVSQQDKAPLLEFILTALAECGCTVLHHSDPGEAPFRITFETRAGERLGILVYAFFANSRLTRNRPSDEHRFQVKYGPDDRKEHSLWQDPFGLYTTLFCGIDPERKIFVGADPVLHSPTRFYISVEYKAEHVERIQRDGWTCWERQHRALEHRPVEVLVGGTAKAFLRYVQFERDALGEDQGHRMLLAEASPLRSALASTGGPGTIAQPPVYLHALAAEFELSAEQVLDLIASARRLKMAVRGWVAEEHLVRTLSQVHGVTRCIRLDAEGGPDLEVDFRGTTLSIECKNVLRRPTGDGLSRVDFQRTRASPSDPCSRYYTPSEFDLVAACLHATTERWEFRYVPTGALQPHPNCPGRLFHRVHVDGRWSDDAERVLQRAALR